MLGVQIEADKEIKDSMAKHTSIKGFIENDKRLRHDVNGAEVKKVFSEPLELLYFRLNAILVMSLQHFVKELGLTID